MKKEDTRITNFIERLENLESGEKARFKRNAGKTLDKASNIVGTFFRILPHGVQPYDEGWFFLVATLYPTAPAGGTGSLGNMLRQARTPENSKGLDRRVEILLDSDTDQLPHRLRRHIQFLAANGKHVDWTTLLADLTQWSHPDSYVRQNWARDYFTTPSKPD